MISREKCKTRKMGDY